MKNKIFVATILIAFQLNAQSTLISNYTVYSFGEGGNLKMLYDRRQRPQAIKEGNEIYLVYNGHRVNNDEKPSRKERSINAKIKEDEERNNKSNAPELELTEGDNKIKDVNFLK